MSSLLGRNALQRGAGGVNGPMVQSAVSLPGDEGHGSILSLLKDRSPSLVAFFCRSNESTSPIRISDGILDTLSLLKDLGLATGLTAGAGGDNFSHSSGLSEVARNVSAIPVLPVDFQTRTTGNSMIFTIEITLTVTGLSRWTKVVETVFQYLEMLRRHPHGPR